MYYVIILSDFDNTFCLQHIRNLRRIDWSCTIHITAGPRYLSLVGFLKVMEEEPMDIERYVGM
jgi:hypothetical protein